MHNSTNLLKPDWTSDGSVVYRGLVKCVGKDKNCLTKIPTKRKENPAPLPGFLFIANVRLWLRFQPVDATHSLNFSAGE